MPTEHAAMQWFPRSLERQLMWLTAFCLSISLLAYGGYAALRQTQQASAVFSAQMGALGQNLATVSAHFLATEDLDGLEVIANQTAPVPGMQSVVVVNTEGKPMLELVNRKGSWSPRFDTQVLPVPTLGDPTTQPPPPAGMLAVWRPIVAGVHMGWVRVMYKPDSFGDAAQAIWIQALGLLVTAVALTLVLLKRLLRVPMQSLQVATAFADDLHHALGQHIAVDSRTSELEALGNALNRVSVRLLEQNQALTHATEQAQAASLSKSQFLANMSHEIRTPMNAILGMLTLLRKTELTARQADYAAKSDGAARALLGLLNEILDFSKIEAGKMALDPHPFALDQLLRDLSVILSANVGDKPVEVLFDIDPEVPRQLIGDAMRLQQVLINLGGNAIKFTAQGEVILGVKVLRRTQDAVTLQWSMQDSGIGIAPENQARIFSGFTQAESSTTRRFGGTGLGVAISQRFVALMGGELELQSELGKGSRFFFTITLPVVASGEQEKAQRSEADRPTTAYSVRGASTEPLLQGMRLLLVEDNLNNQQVARELLEDEGAQVQLANHGREAVEALAAAPTAFDVVLMDLQMPVMDGFTAARTIRKDLGLLQLPIVAMTANAMASDRQACLDAGMNDHVGKPFDLQNLVQVLRRWAGWTQSGNALPAPTAELSTPVRTAALAAAVDLPVALQRLGGRQEIYTRMLATFVRDLHDMPDQLQASVQGGKAQDCQRQLHTLKGLAATLGAQALSAQAALAEKAVQASVGAASTATAVQQASQAVAQALPPLQGLLDALLAEHNSAPGHRVTVAIDQGALDLALRTLATLLEAADMEAMHAMAELEASFADVLGVDMEPLQAAMADLNFEAALLHCKALQKRNFG